MSATVDIQWTWRPGGGLFVGLRVHRPVRVLFDCGEVRDVVSASIGFGPVSVLLEFKSRVIENRSAY